VQGSITFGAGEITDWDLSDTCNNCLPEMPTQRDLKLKVPDGFGGLKDLPDGADPATGSALITPTDSQTLSPNDNDPGPRL
jgi:hypothetical protein